MKDYYEQDGAEDTVNLLRKGGYFAEEKGSVSGFRLFVENVIIMTIASSFVAILAAVMYSKYVAS